MSNELAGIKLTRGEINDIVSTHKATIVFERLLNLLSYPIVETSIRLTPVSGTISSFPNQISGVPVNVFLVCIPAISGSTNNWGVYLPSAGNSFDCQTITLYASDPLTAFALYPPSGILVGLVPPSIAANQVVTWKYSALTKTWYYV